MLLRRHSLSKTNKIMVLQALICSLFILRRFQPVQNAESQHYSSAFSTSMAIIPEE